MVLWCVRGWYVLEPWYCCCVVWTSQHNYYTIYATDAMSSSLNPASSVLAWSRLGPQKRGHVYQPQQHHIHEKYTYMSTIHINKTDCSLQTSISKNTKMIPLELPVATTP